MSAPPAKKAKTLAHTHDLVVPTDKFEDPNSSYPGDFPMDLSTYKKVDINPYEQESLSAEQVAAIEFNIELCRATIMFFTTCGSASGYGGHTGGAFDTVPECMLLDAIFRTVPDKVVDVLYDEAGHRVATQYLMAALQGHISPNHLVNYRRGYSKLPGHPELGLTPGIKFSSGRLGHMWPTVNGVAVANPGKTCFMLGSDGSQMEGNDAEAARLAASEGMKVVCIIDDNDVTIAGHPTDYFKGYNIEKTLEGHSIPCKVVRPEEGVNALYQAIREGMLAEGPFAIVNKRKMCPGVDQLEGECNGHDAAAPKYALPYLRCRGYEEAAKFVESIQKTKDPYTYKGAGKVESMRKTAGKAICACVGALGDDRKSKVLVIDSDLGGSTAMTEVQKAYPEVYIQSGIMERGNFATAAGFGMEDGRQGICSTFGAFQEMCISEITMARLNKSNVLSHYSHNGVDDMADNTCHFGINQMFADNGLDDQYTTELYMPGDALQVKAAIDVIFPRPGLRFFYTVRSSTPLILKEDGSNFYGEGYTFVPGVDEYIREGTAGYIMAFGDALYRALDACIRLKKQGIDVGLINKPSLNMIDEASMAKIGASPALLIVEPFNANTGLGSKFGTHLLTRGFAPKFGVIGVHREGSGGLWEQAYHQGYDPLSIMDKFKSL